MNKSTARAHSNIAFIKYWGRKNEELRLPSNGSISMNVSNLHTTTTVEFQNDLLHDSVEINGVVNEPQAKRVSAHLDRIRNRAGIRTKARVVSQNSFPTGTGLSSSASGFAALTVAASRAAGLQLSEKELSILARQGSGSACRSIPEGFVEWLDGNTNEESYAVSLHGAQHWDLIDFVAVVSTSPKDVPTSEGQKRVGSSIFFETRLTHIRKKIETCKRLLLERSFDAFGELAEMEALEMHAVMLTSRPSLIYWLPSTITVMKSVQKWRSEGLSVYFTINTGQDVHILCQKKDQAEVQAKLDSLDCIGATIANTPAKGAYTITENLF